MLHARAHPAQAPPLSGVRPTGHADFPGQPGTRTSRAQPGTRTSRAQPGTRTSGVVGKRRAGTNLRAGRPVNRERLALTGHVLPLASRAAACGRAILGSSRQVTATPVSTVMSMSAMASGRPAGELQTSNQASAAISVAVAAVPARDACTLWRGRMLRGPGRFFNWPASDGVGDGAGGVAASGGGDPGVVAGLVLLEFPSGGLLEVVVVPAAGPGVAAACAAALVPGDGVLEVAAAGVAQAGRVGAFAVPDLD